MDLSCFKGKCKANTLIRYDCIIKMYVSGNDVIRNIHFFDRSENAVIKRIASNITRLVFYTERFFIPGVPARRAVAFFNSNLGCVDIGFKGSKICILICVNGNVHKHRTVSFDA